MAHLLSKIEEISRLTGKSLEEIMFLTGFNEQQLCAYHYIVMTCAQHQERG